MTDLSKDLVNICESADTAALATAIERDPDVVHMREAERGGTLLTIACRSDGDQAIDVVKLLLAAAADPTVRDNSGVTPLIIASSRGNSTIVGMLLAAGAEVDAAEPNFNATPLIAACGNGHAEVVSLLLAHSANLEAVDILDRTCLFCACSAGHGEVVEQLITAGARLEARGMSEDDETNSSHRSSRPSQRGSATPALCLSRLALRSTGAQAEWAGSCCHTAEKRKTRNFLSYW